MCIFLRRLQFYRFSSNIITLYFSVLYLPLSPMVQLPLNTSRHFQLFNPNKRKSGLTICHHNKHPISLLVRECHITHWFLNLKKKLYCTWGGAIDNKSIYDLMYSNLLERLSITQSYHAYLYLHATGDSFIPLTNCK